MDANTLTPDQIIENLLTTDYRGRDFKRECLVRVLTDKALQATLIGLFAVGQK